MWTQTPQDTFNFNQLIFPGKQNDQLLTICAQVGRGSERIVEILGSLKSDKNSSFNCEKKLITEVNDLASGLVSSPLIITLFMKISYITDYDALDIHNWSGLGFNIAKALENQNAELKYIGNLKAGKDLRNFVKKVFYKGLGKDYLIKRTVSTARQLAHQAEKLISNDTEIVFSPGTLPIALMENRYPKVFYTDATFAGMLNFYPDYDNLSKESIRIGHFLEQKALDNCVLAIYASDWAARTALENYRVDPAKIKVVPFGANLNSNFSITDIKAIVERRSKVICKLLFLGVDWKRKGGELALGVAEQLNVMGIKTELHIAGIKKLPLTTLPNFVTNHGVFSKSKLEDVNNLERLFCESHFLIVPSVAEAYGLVFCEANAFGVPALATNVGGIPSIIKNGINGATFSVADGIFKYTNFISTYFNDFKRYETLANSSFSEFQSRLNWGVSGKRITKMLEDLL